MYCSDDTPTSAVKPLLLNNQSTSAYNCNVYVEEVYGMYYDTTGSFCFTGTKTGEHKWENGQ